MWTLRQSPNGVHIREVLLYMNLYEICVNVKYNNRNIVPTIIILAVVSL